MLTLSWIVREAHLNVTDRSQCRSVFSCSGISVSDLEPKSRVGIES
jgi:hypothetical protein